VTDVVSTEDLATTPAAPEPRRRESRLHRVNPPPDDRAFLASPSGIAGLSFVLFIFLIAIIAPEFLNHRAQTFDFGHVSEHPSWAHPLGTDQLGRDNLSRLLVATRLSVGLALSATAIALSIGVTIGSSAALIKPRWRPVLLRTIDTLLSFPVILDRHLRHRDQPPGHEGRAARRRHRALLRPRANHEHARPVGRRARVRECCQGVGVKRRRLMLR